MTDPTRWRTRSSERTPPRLEDPEHLAMREAGQAPPLSPDLLHKIAIALQNLESILQEMKSEGIKSTTETNAGYGYSPLDDVSGAIGMLSNALEDRYKLDR